jgi:hypothetical protein
MLLENYSLFITKLVKQALGAIFNQEITVENGRIKQG